MENYSINISTEQNSIIPNETAEITNFHFSHYNSMETLSYHSNESSWTLKIKYITFVEGNVISKYVKFQLHPPYGSENKNFEYFFFQKIYPVCHTSNQSN